VAKLIFCMLTTLEQIWHANTYKLEQSLSYGLERAWCVSYQRGKNGVALGFDDGAVVISMGREVPCVSMDAGGKIIYSRNNEVLTTIIKGTEATTDGQPLVLQPKELGNTENYPQTLSHSPNGRFVAVCGDGTYTLYTALAWRTQQFGSALDFVWGDKTQSQNNDFAIRESSTSVKMFRKLKERPAGLDVGFQAEGLSGGMSFICYFTCRANMCRCTTWRKGCRWNRIFRLGNGCSSQKDRSRSQRSVRSSPFRS